MATGKNILKNTNGTTRIDGIMQLIEEIEITGAAVTNFDFATVLDGNNDGGYMIEGFYINDSTAGNSNLRMRFNAAQCVTDRSFVYQTGASTLTGGYQAGGATPNIVGAEDADGTAVQSAFIFNMPISTTGQERFWSSVSSKAVAGSGRVGIFSIEGRMTTPNTATNITSIGVVSDIANGIGIGSIFRLWRLNNAN